MKQGLLWYEDDPRKQLEEIVRCAARRYKHKHGHSPNLCFVHPAALFADRQALGDNLSARLVCRQAGQAGENGKVRKVGEVEIRTGRSVLPHHFWIGVTEKPRQIRMKLTTGG